MPPPCRFLLTVLQSCHCLRLRTEVTVPDVVGCFHSQFVRGEWVQAVECKKQGWGMEISPYHHVLPQNKSLQRTCPLATKVLEQFVSSPHHLFFTASPSFLMAWGCLHHCCHQHLLRFALAWAPENMHGFTAEQGSSKQPLSCSLWSSLRLELVGDNKMCCQVL